MSEMLANQYFMARKYLEAEVELEEVLTKDPSNKAVRKKIIVCYTHNNKIEKAIDFLLELISEDINFVAETDPIQDDCPCYELIAEIEKKKLYVNQSTKHYLMLGVFWLYCNYKISIENFKKALEIDKNNEVVLKLIKLIEEYSINKKLKDKTLAEK